MTRGNAISAALLAAALAGAPATYAATAGMTGTITNPSSSTMKSQAPTMTNSEQSAIKVTTPMASQASGTPVMSPAKPAIRYVGLSDQVRAQDIASFGSSKVTLDRAISSAEQKLDGRAVEAVFKAEPVRPHYVIRIMKGDRLTSAWVDASTGRGTHSRHSVALRQLYPGERAELMRADQSPDSLADAVAFAQRESGNQPIAARIERSEGTLAYDVATVSKGTLQSVWVSPDNPTMMASK